MNVGEYERGTGKTFRSLLGTLISASSGKSVIHIVKDQYAVRSTYNEILSLSERFAPGFAKEYSPLTGVITFKNGGEIRIVSANSKGLKSIRSDMVVMDVYMDELGDDIRPSLVNVKLTSFW